MNEIEERPEYAYEQTQMTVDYGIHSEEFTFTGKIKYFSFSLS